MSKVYRYLVSSSPQGGWVQIHRRLGDCASTARTVWCRSVEVLSHGMV